MFKEISVFGSDSRSIFKDRQMIRERLSADGDASEVDEGLVDLLYESDSRYELSENQKKKKKKPYYDPIYKGRKLKPLTEDDVLEEERYTANSVDDKSHYWNDRNGENVPRELSERVFKTMVYMGGADVAHAGGGLPDEDKRKGRRKPSRKNLNRYFSELIKVCDITMYGYCAVFVELTTYFTDYPFTVFHLLDEKYANLIIGELTEGRDLSGKIKSDVMGHQVCMDDVSFF